MFKVTEPKKAEIPNSKFMGEMLPCEICRIVDEPERIVMRTASSRTFEVMELFPCPGQDSCWTGIKGSKGYRVVPLTPGETISLEVTEER